MATHFRVTIALTVVTGILMGWQLFFTSDAGKKPHIIRGSILYALMIISIIINVTMTKMPLVELLRQKGPLMHMSFGTLSLIAMTLALITGVKKKYRPDISLAHKFLGWLCGLFWLLAVLASFFIEFSKVR